MTQRDYQPISSYAIIGDCHTAALITLDGSIDWYRPRRFDGPAVFCRILDKDRGGYFSVTPDGRFEVQRGYLEATNLLQSNFSIGESGVRITDFMPVRRRSTSRQGHDVGTSRRIIKLVEGLSGEAQFTVRFKPTFNYARDNAEIQIRPRIGVVARHGRQYLSLTSPGVELNFREGDLAEYTADLRVAAGDRLWLVLTSSDDPDRVAEMPSIEQCQEQLQHTQLYWKNWAGACTYDGPYDRQVLRSALTLKLLTYEPIGAIIAAPSTSLPETIGGERNWDYHYSWIRDSSLILYALINIGYHEEAADFFDWLQNTHKQDRTPGLHVLYGIDGEQNLDETILKNLEGYRSSRPVRIGNGAAKQFQLDIYGEILNAAYLYFKSAGGAETQTGLLKRLQQDWPLFQELVQRAIRRWQEPDNGIWEIRNQRQHFLYSKLLCWAAVDRGITLAREYSLPASLETWETVREEIRRAIITRGYNREQQSFVQYLDGSVLDASALAIPRIGFLPARDPRVKSTIARIKNQLTANKLVYRYRANDGIAGGESTFALCSFWMVDALALSGDLDEAHELFKHMLSFSNDLGLFSEEIDPVKNELSGNFPQGYTHTALINAAVNLAKITRHGLEELSENEAERTIKARAAAA